jgi:hypothetical protein
MIAFRQLIQLCQAALDIADPLVDRFARLLVGRQISKGQVPRQVVPYFLPPVHSRQHRIGNQ